MIVSFFKLTRKDGLFTLISTNTKNYYNNLKNTFLKDCTFYNDYLYRIIRSDGLSTLIYKTDGSFVYDNFWFKDWIDFNHDYYRVIRKDGLSTLINKKDGSFIYDSDNIWFNDWKIFNDNYYKLINKKGLSNLMRIKNGFLMFDEWIPESNVENLSNNLFSVIIHDTLHIYKDE